MADIRINALATTATTPASDDYLALDGTAQGTRKILATNIANNVTDVILGTSGPSVKSSLSARAPRQGLVFDGTANATGTVAAFGATDFSFFTWVNVTSFASARSIIGGGTGAFVFSVNTSGALVVGKYGSADLAVSTSTLTAGKNTLVGYVRSGTTGTYYINGIAAGTTSDSYNYTAAISQIGANGGGSSIFLGVIDPIYPYNRALSASEVVALYEAGAPAGADYNSASNTALNTSAFQQSALPYTTFTSATATGFSATATGTGNYVAVSRPQFPVRIGCRYRVSFSLTLNSGGAPRIKLALFGGSDYSAYQQSAAGSNVMEFVATGTTSTAEVHVWTTGTTTDFTISNFSVTPLGLLLAPDAAQAGGGLVWYDTSGNAANITLPASGVSWNVPSSRYLGGNWTTSGNLTVSGTGTFSGNLSATGEISCNGSGGALRADSRTGSGLNWYIYNPTGADLRLFNSTGGNVLILTNAGAATLTGNLTVNGTGTSSFESTTPPTVQIANTTSGLANTQTAANNVVLGTLKFGHPSDGQSDKFPSIVGRFDPTDASFARATQLEFYTSSAAGNALGMTLNKTGNFLIGTTTDRSNRVHIAAAGPSYIGMGQLTSTYAGIVFGDVTLADSASGFNIAGNAANSNLVFNVNTGGSMNWRVGNANAFTLSSGSNLLIGGTTDGGNGNLQLKDTSGSSTKGIGFGPDTALFRSAAYTLKLDGGNNVTSFRVLGSGSCEALMAVTSASSVLFGSTTAGASTVLCSGNGTTALTLDSSQNATVVGTLTAKGRAIVDANGDSNARQFLSGTASSGAMITDLSTYAAFKSRGAGGVYLLDASNNQLIKAEATTGNTSILGSITTSAPTGGAGAWELGVANTVSPTAPNRTITIEIGGTVYYLHAKTTND